MKVGVIGIGVVGGAVYKGFQQLGSLVVSAYDKYKPEFNDVPGVISSDVIFICVPTATDVDGKQDLAPLEETMQMLKFNNFKGVAVVKSTVLPGTTRRLSESTGLKRVCHNPEFLTAARPFEDFMNQESILISGDIQDSALVADVYCIAGFDFHSVLRFEKLEVTETAKYMHNLFLSVKVSFCNEIYDSCQMLDVKYNDVLIATTSINQIGAGHTRVPGPDGARGFSGMCFPKDTSAFLRFMKENNLPCEILEAAVTQNKRIRPDAYNK